MTCPASGNRCAMSATKYLAARRFAIFFSVAVEATHLPPTPDMTNCVEKTWARALELEGARVCDGGKKAWVKMRNSYPFIEATKAVCLPTSLSRIAYFPSTAIDGTGLYPYPY